MFDMYACEMTHEEQKEDETGIWCSLCSIVVGLLLATVRRRRLLLEIHDDGDTVDYATGISREQQLWQPPPQGRGREQRCRGSPSSLAHFLLFLAVHLPGRLPPQRCLIRHISQQSSQSSSRQQSNESGMSYDVAVRHRIELCQIANECSMWS